jgi:type I restriction enzyme S subunit
MTLGEVCELKRGYDLPTQRRVDGDVPIVSSSGVTGYHSEAKVQAPGVVTGRYGTLGEVFFIKEDFWPLNTALYVRDFKGNEPRFVAALLQSLDLGTNDGAAAVPGVNRNQLHRLLVRRPDADTQRQIGRVLTGLDDLIENNRRRIELLEQMAQAIYREWFVYFRYPGREDATLVDSPLGPLPEGWELRQLNEVATIVRGRSYRKHELVDAGGMPFVNLKCMIRGGGFRRDGLKRYDGKHTCDQRVSAGDIVLAVTDLTQGREILARATLVPRLREEFGVISLDVIRIVPVDPEDRLAVYFALRCTDFPDRVKEFANGSTVLHLSPTHVAEGAVIWPADHLRRRFAQVVEPMIGQVDDLSDASEHLAGIRDLLLPRLVTGQIDVSELDLDALTESVA